MKQRKLNDSTVSKTLPVIPDAPPPNPGKAVEVVVFVAIVDFAIVVVAWVVAFVVALVVALVVAFADDVSAVAD